MAVRLYEESNILNIANAIREVGKTTSKYKVSEMANAIKNIVTGISGEELNPYYVINTNTSYANQLSSGNIVEKKYHILIFIGYNHNLRTGTLTLETSGLESGWTQLLNTTKNSELSIQIYSSIDGIICNPSCTTRFTGTTTYLGACVFGLGA